MDIQKIDCGNLHSYDMKQRFLGSLMNTGFAVLTNTDLAPSMILEIQESWKSYFQKPMGVKMANKFDPATQTGYFPYKSETAKGEDLADLKEFYHVYTEADIPGIGAGGKLETNILIHMLKNYGDELLQIIGQDLNRGLDLADTVEVSGRNLFRPIYYPPVSPDSKGVRAAAHEDINFLTLLVGASASGLEVKDNAGNWHKVETAPNEVVVNVGDMLQMLSNGVYKSTTHRVVNPNNSTADRLAMPLFLHPEKDFDLGPMTAGEYLDERLKELGLK